MEKLNLKYVSYKDGDYYFKINNPEEFLKKHEYVENSETYYPMFEGRYSDDYILKVKSRYLQELDVNRAEPFDAEVSLKSFRMQGRDKKLKYGLYVNSFR